MIKRFITLLEAQRSATRLAFLLQIICRVLTSLLSLLWTPLLLGSMGKALNGLFLSFQSVASLGGLGDFGMGGMVNIQTSRLLGQGDDAGLRTFLAGARAFFGVVTLAAMLIFLLLSPSLFAWLNFHTVPAAGSLGWLYVIGALTVGLVILNSYISNLNYGCSNVTWPVIPGFVLLQLSLLGHWLLARQQYPLWIQCAPYVGAAWLTQLLGWFYIRRSHPGLGTVRPLHFGWKQLLTLAGQSFWVYLYCLAGGIGIFISRLLINAGFGPESLPAYQYNYRLCELAMFVIVSASLASLPKITQWLASPEAATRERALRETERLNKFQTFLGCGAALIYLSVNDWFIGLWLGPDLRVPLSWQAAFAANLAVYAAGLVGFDLAARCCDQGMRVGGISVFLSALLNLGLSWAAVKAGSILGIAVAGVVSLSAVTLWLGWFTCTHTGASWWRLSLRNWLLALGSVGVGLAVRRWLPANSPAGLGLTAAVYALTLLGVGAVIGAKVSDVREEIKIVRAMFSRPPTRDPG